MNSLLARTEEEIVNRLSIWIKSFSWDEYDEQTGAVMKFTVAGITDWHLDKIVDVNALDDYVIKQVVAKKAEQFVDVFTIVEMSWEIVDVTDAIGRSTSEIQVYASLRLAEDAAGAIKVHRGRLECYRKSKNDAL